MKMIIQDRKILYFILSIVLVLVFTLTVAYAALNTVLKITGNAEVVASSWDIYLDNVQLINGSATTTKPTITDKTTASFQTTLTNPGDYYMFTVDVVNNGTIDAMIDSIEKTPTLTNSQAKYLNYIVEYQSGESITTKQLVEADSFLRLKVKVEFRKDISASDLPSAIETLNLSFKVNYIQAEENITTTIQNSGKLVKVVSGDYDTVGSEICIKDECFYVISNTEDTVTMLSKYNLYIGGTWDVNKEIWTPHEGTTGIQEQTMIGWMSNESLYKGTTVFSSDTQKGANLSDYNGSIVEGYVNNYNVYLNSQGVKMKETRLITKEELESLGCDSISNSCALAPTWVYSTTYWTGTANTDTQIWTVITNKAFDDTFHYGNNRGFGVRPVITISKS